MLGSGEGMDRPLQFNWTNTQRAAGVPQCTQAAARNACRRTSIARLPARLPAGPTGIESDAGDAIVHQGRGQALHHGSAQAAALPGGRHRHVPNHCRQGAVRGGPSKAQHLQGRGQAQCSWRVCRSVWLSVQRRVPEACPSGGSRHPCHMPQQRLTAPLPHAPAAVHGTPATYPSSSTHYPRHMPQRRLTPPSPPRPARTCPCLASRDLRAARTHTVRYVFSSASARRLGSRRGKPTCIGARMGGQQAAW